MTRTVATTATSPKPGDATDELRDRIVEELHTAIVALRCAASARGVKSGLSMTHRQVLWLVQHHGDLPMSRIADVLDVSLSNASGIVDRMEERGLIERIRTPDDRRLVLVRPTKAGLQALDDVETLKHDRMRAVLTQLDETQLRRVHHAFEDVREAMTATGIDLEAHAHQTRKVTA